MEDQQTPKNSNGLYLGFIFILLIGIASLAYAWSTQRSKLNECRNENAQLTNDMASMEEMLGGYVNVGDLSKDLKKDFRNMLDNYDKLIEMDATKADSLNKQKDRINDLLKKVESGKLSYRELMKVRKENETLRGIMRSYVRTIDSLNTLNIRIGTELVETSAKLTTTSTERDEYRKAAETSQQQVKKGSKLQAYNIQSTALRLKLNNMPEPTDKAKNAVQIRSSFTISENILTNAGKKVVYMQVIGPDGQSLQTKANYILETENGSVAYSERKEIDYQNEAIDLTIYYSVKGEGLQKGAYKVSIFCDGNLIGTDSFSLK